jgi:hypothetical protein
MEPRCAGDACKILSKGTKVRAILDEPRSAATGRKLHGKFRAGDIRWDPITREIEQVVIKPGQPPLYYVSGIDNAAYTKAQLQPIPADELEPPAELAKKITILKRDKQKTKVMYLIKQRGRPEEWIQRVELIKRFPDEVKAFEGTIAR